MIPTRTRYQAATCRQCGWSWQPRKPSPIACPNCGSRQWAEPLTPSERSQREEHAS